MIEKTNNQRFDWLQDEALQTVLEALDAANGKARVVGGAVRNSLLGLPVADVDIATVWLPEQITKRIEAAGLRAVATGISHGTVTAICNNRPFEITTLRIDLSGDGRHAEIAYTQDWVADAARRDFTINALYLNSDGTIFDPLGGQQDVEERRVRFIGIADDRIHEDYLRILRFFRFFAQFSSGDIDVEGLAACIRGRIGVRELSAERVRAELLRLLEIKRCVETVETLSFTGILTDLLGGVAYLGTLRNIVAIEMALKLSPDRLLRLAVVACKIREDAARLARRLRLSKLEAKRISKVMDGYWRLTPALSVQDCQKQIYHSGPNIFRDRVLMAWARSGADPDATDWLTLFTFPDRWKVPVFPINATIVMERGIGPGEQLGSILRIAEDIWIDEEFPQDKVALSVILDRAVAQT